ncbi:MAG: glycosyltransferase family 2 protein [Bacteroidales bacterium]|nr:glycosyltransferase family 2 protein [Bacteroidales bacterium]
MTPVRNEAWVLGAFLEATSLWADYIIIVDQMSTDGSREIAKSYDKVILIDNKNPEFNEAERQAMLVAKAREVAAGRDTLLWGLDADEVLAANAFETNDWMHILNSVPGDVFWFKWAEICPNQEEYWLSPTTYYPWLFHDDGKEPHGNYVRNMHSMRIPYPIKEKQMYYVDDFRVLHLAYLNRHRVDSKRRFYQFVDWEMNGRSPLALSRSYTMLKNDEQVLPLPNEFLYHKEQYGFDLLSMVDTEVAKCYMDEYVVERFSRHAMSELRKLDIWDEAFRDAYGLEDPQRMVDKWIHSYLRKTVTKRNNTAIRFLDKIIKKLY